MSACRPPLPDDWKVDEDWNEHECDYHEESGEEYCTRVFRVYGPEGVTGPGADDEVEAVNAAIDAGLLPGHGRWRWVTEEEAAQERAERLASIASAAHVRMTAKRTIEAGQLVTSADVKPKAAPVVKVTEVVGFVDVDALAGMAIEDSATGRGVYMSDILPEGVEGKRGRFVVTVVFTPEGEDR